MNKAIVDQSKHQLLDQVDWAQQNWFERHFESTNSDDPTGYFGYQNNGYQKFRQERIVQLICSFRESIATGAMLDIGCATGLLTSTISDKLGFEKVRGIDFVKSMLEHAQVIYPKIEFRYGCLPHIDCPSESYDLVVASEVIYYLNTMARIKALDEIHRVLRSGGYLLFSSRLGANYFSFDAALRYIQSMFKITKVQSDYQLFYHKTFGNLFAFVRLSRLLTQDIKPGTEKTRAMIDRLRPLCTNKLAQKVLKVVPRVCGRLVESTSIPRFFFYTCGTLAPTISRNNVVILARKG